LQVLRAVNSKDNPREQVKEYLEYLFSQKTGRLPCIVLLEAIGVPFEFLTAALPLQGKTGVMR